MVDIILMQHVTLSKSRLCEPPYLLSIGCNTSPLRRHPVAVLWDQVLCLSVLAVLLVLWRSPAPDRLSEAHVAMFTRKHSVRLRICCSVFPALWVNPALVGMPGPRTPWDSPSPAGRRGNPPQCWYGNRTISHIWEELDLVSCYCGAPAPDLARACRAWAWGGLRPVVLLRPAGAGPLGCPYWSGSQRPGPSLQGGGGSWELYK